VDLGGTEIRVLNPRPPEWERRRVRNADSVVLDVRYGKVSLLLMGDADESVEPFIASELTPAVVRILKVGHHGSRTSSSLAFIQAARPAAGLISCGRHNRFGHPAEEVLARFEAADVRVFRTDHQGAIAIETDGRSVWVDAFTGERAVFGGQPLAPVAPRLVRRWVLHEAVARWLQRTQAGGSIRAP
jgi:competence protein ComEC